MKIRTIEIIVLLGVTALLGAGSCGPIGCVDPNELLEGVLGALAGSEVDPDVVGYPPDKHLLTCAKNASGDGYHVESKSVRYSTIPGPDQVLTYAPTSNFNCAPSKPGQTSPPRPQTIADVPSDSATPSIRKGSSGAQQPFLQSAPYRPYGYNNGYVPPGVIDPYIPVPINPGQRLPSSCPAQSPDVIIVDHIDNSLTRLGTCPFSTKATIPLASRPMEVAVTPDGSQAIVTNFDNAISFVNLASNTVSFTLKTDASINPAGVAITPDGKRVYVTSFNNVNSVILVIDIASHGILTTIPAGAWPLGVFISPDGSQAWVSYPFNNEVDVFDTLTNTQSAARVVNSPGGIGFNSTGTRAYVASGGNPGTLMAFDTATFRGIKSYTVGTTPLDVRVLPGDRFVVVNNFDSANQSTVDTDSGTVVTTQPASTGTQSMGLVLIY